MKSEQAKLVRESVLAALASELKIPLKRIETSSNLFSDGLDSIAYIELIQKLEDLHQIQLTDTELASTETATLDGLTLLFERKIREKTG